ncbi:indolepyruvate oxidoreductase subunit beta [Desulfovibrio sp. OttesenSCG-928-I05]|nr:indolepyruvate oxidoreductase subunit beta [Desulfovibrio sp. OttesenSCG-928-I05]
MSPDTKSFPASRARIHFAGVGGQGTLTATTLLSRAALEAGLAVVSGEIHGMAQRGGVVESSVLLGGWTSSVISKGEADIILGFEAMETLRALPYLRQGGAVFSSTDFVAPPGVSSGKESAPDLAAVQKLVGGCVEKAWFLPCRELGIQAGSAQCANTVLLGALCATDLIPFGPEELKGTITRHLPARLVDMNLKAVDLGVAAVS